MAQKQIIIICGEASGDLNAGSLAKEILKNHPDIKISGVGGDILRQAGVDIFYEIKDLAVIGLFDALVKLPRFLSLKELILQKIQTTKPDLIIMVDFSGFNLRLAKEINKKVPIIYYTSPQVWASRPGRIKTIKEYINKMLVLFKFEEALYRKYGIDADFVGHPLLDTVGPTMSKDEFLSKFDLSNSKTTIALLPGSRGQEIENCLPVMLEAAVLLRKKINHTQFVIAKSPQVNWQAYHRLIQGIKIDLEVVEGKTYDCINAADFCLVASGTATLETAILQKPFVIIYKMDILNYLLYKPQVKVPYIGMVNIVAGRKIVPEFIQFQASPKEISDEVIKLLGSPSKLERMKKDLAQVKASLGDNGASSRAARIVINFLSK